MKKSNTVVFVILVVLFCGAISSFAGGIKCNSIKDAEYFWRTGEEKNARLCIRQLIDQRKGGAEAHFIQGEICLADGDNGCARKKFQIPEVRKQFSQQIAELYKKRADASLRAGKIKGAEENYTEAMDYNPTIIKTVAKGLFDQGKQSGNDQQLFLAGRLDRGLKGAITQYYVSLSKNAKTKEDQLDFLGKAAEYDDSQRALYTENKANLGKFHLEEAKKWARKVGKDGVAAEHKALARKYLGDAAVNAELPEIRKFYKVEGGTNIGFFEAGEQTPYRIAVGEMGSIGFLATNLKFKVVLDDGQEFCIWKEEDVQRLNNMPRNNSLMKLVAVERVSIKVTVK